MEIFTVPLFRGKVHMFFRCVVPIHLPLTKLLRQLAKSGNGVGFCHPCGQDL